MKTQNKINNQEKTIKLSENIWNKLWDMKRKYHAKSMNVLVGALIKIERQFQPEIREELER